MNAAYSTGGPGVVLAGGHEATIDVPAALLRQAQRGGRAIGATFFAFFGGSWLVLGYFLAPWRSAIALPLVAIGTLLLAVAAVRVVRKNRDAMAALRSAPAYRRMRRQFVAVNVAQWVGISVAVNVLNGLDLGQWIAPAIMLIVGLHFLPLARMFRHRPHYLTGAALIVTALICPLAGRSDPWSAAACLAAGAILWLSALWSLRPEPA